MSIFHQHIWEVQSETYTPRAGSFESARIDTELLEKMMFGFTTIRMKCKTCGEIATKTIIGKEVKDV